MFKKLLALFAFIFFALTQTGTVFAGGAMMAIYADTSGSTNNDGLYLRVIRVFLHPELSCKGSQITFKFQDPKDGDYIMTGSGTPTYTMQEDRTSNGCGTYAKMGSKIKGVRQINVDVTSNNQAGAFMNQKGIPLNVDFDGEYHADNSYNGYSYRTAITDPYAGMTFPTNPTNVPAPSTTINAWILNQYVDSAGIFRVTVKWGAFDGHPGTFSILGTTDKVNWETLSDGQKGPSETVAVKSNGNYFLKVHGCVDKWGTCADSNVLMVSNNNTNQNEKYVPSQNNNPQITSGATNLDNNQQVNELNQKVASLEAKLGEAQKKQSALEETVNTLLSWIKSRFWFFK